MHKNDIADFFGFSRVTVEQLKKLGYVSWYGNVEEPGSWISEGDTSMYMNLLDNGLDAHIDASYGGWGGGRNGKDIDSNNVASKDYASSRWFGAAQRDFAARIQWTVTPEYEDSNHHPVVELVGLEDTTVKPGQTITLKAIVKDPDGDHLIGHWRQYEETGTYPGKLELISVEEDTKMGGIGCSYPFNVPAPGSSEVAKLMKNEIEVTSQFKVPTDAANGQTIHFILEATDNGYKPLTSYKRVVLTVSREKQ
ncbi:hypothetical NagD-like phosphatase [Gracilibacillus boraciitolerans JCM 21714]|uniref:Hypothetical NagD-like phosphatase n=1 Tax=Gracilibacillus boraciitolerans JCM 21714 TaxID=1298598 RepID=W4VJV4_9BACI|nr:nucleoside hydrolase-like domain-containing protein [Gracilibacillus boraciitolerans]GAE93108.1 hypothetical NagD-like phosphatase [Gracilibacillus boraciitolerans JCM 21714]